MGGVVPRPDLVLCAGVGATRWVWSEQGPSREELCCGPLVAGRNGEKPFHVMFATARTNNTTVERTREPLKYRLYL